MHSATTANNQLDPYNSGCSRNCNFQRLYFAKIRTNSNKQINGNKKLARGPSMKPFIQRGEGTDA